MAKSDEEESARGFKVQDRRRFVDDSPPSAEASTAEAATSPAPEPGSTPADHGAHAHSDALPEITFSTFIMGLTTQALMHLGEIADPEHPAPPDLIAAKQMIDLLGILREKTTGNLEAAEEQLLASMLYDLRMRYVEVSRHR